MLTVLYLYYDQPKAIGFLESIGCPSYPLKFVFVDDGSKEPLALGWPNAEVIRIEKDIPWNMSAANNAGFRGLSGKVLRLDIDHYLEGDQIEALKDTKIARGELAIFPRYRADMAKLLMPAPNIYMIHAEDFWSVGGYDEDYCGHYGYEDKDIRRRYDRAGFRTYLSSLPINVHIGLSTKGLDRNLTRNKHLYICKGKPQLNR
jgi:hypothetical protein